MTKTKLPKWQGGASSPPPTTGGIPLFVRNKLGLGETGPFIINMKGLEVIVVYFTTFKDPNNLEILSVFICIYLQICLNISLSDTDKDILRWNR